jgi:drug/metabolite transporter (DMT)-like permease
MTAGVEAVPGRPAARNLAGSLLMVATMAGFAVEDLLIKLLAATVPVGQIVLVLGIGGAAVFVAIARLRGERLLDRRLLSRPVLLRNAAEIVSNGAGVTALVLLPLSLISSVLQAAPLLVAAGAALFLGERVGWRRWTAICIGLTGVLLILRPGSAALAGTGSSLGLWCAILAMAAIACRDLATRATPAGITTLQLAFWGYSASILTGIVLTLLRQEPWVWPTPSAWAMLLVAQALGITFYYTLTLALMIGESSVVVPFRYSRLVFALALGVGVLGETVDGWMLLGLLLVTGSGLYTLLREARLRRAGAIQAPSPPL